MIDFIIGGIATYTLAALAGGWNALTKDRETPKQKREKERLALWKADMTDVDPITGDYTSKHNGLRYDKHGIPLSRAKD